MFSFDAELPVKCNPFPDESGYGFCLRAIQRNGANLHELRRVLDLPEVQALNNSHAFVLSQIFGISSQWLTSALKEKSHRKIRPQSFWGHKIYLPTHLRWAKPQVCPLCVHRHGYCKAIWDVALSTVCLEHGCLLVDSCTQCGQALRWNRPSVDVGHCKHYIQASTQKANFPDVAFDVQVFLEQKFSAEIDGLKDLQLSQRPTPHLLESSSFGSALIYLSAFGARSLQFDKSFSDITKRHLLTSHWQGIAVKGWTRCQSFDFSSGNKYVDADLVLSKLVLKILVEDANPDDAQLAVSVLQSLNEGELSLDFTRNSPVLRQQILFPNGNV